jgi:hypothetical protein
MRIVVAKFRDSKNKTNTYDIYLNNRLVHSIKPQSWSWDAEKGAETRTILTDFHVGTKEIWFYGQKDFKSYGSFRPTPKIMFNINLTEANRINASALKKVYEKGCKSEDDFKTYYHAKDMSIRKLDWQRVKLFYKPFSSFIEVDLSMLAAHGRYLSVYDRNTLNWREITHQNYINEDG